MQTYRLPTFLAIVSLCAFGALANEPIFNDHETKFKAAYHRWAAHIYENPRIMLSSKSSTYTGVPPFEDIVKLGKPALPFIATEMARNDSDFGLFLGKAILTIQGWTEADFGSPGSLQELNGKIIDRLRLEKVIPAAIPSDPKK